MVRVKHGIWTLLPCFIHLLHELVYKASLSSYYVSVDILNKCSLMKMNIVMRVNHHVNSSDSFLEIFSQNSRGPYVPVQISVGFF